METYNPNSKRDGKMAQADLLAIGPLSPGSRRDQSGWMCSVLIQGSKRFAKEMAEGVSQLLPTRTNDQSEDRIAWTGRVINKYGHIALHCFSGSPHPALRGIGLPCRCPNLLCPGSLPQRRANKGLSPSHPV